MPKRRDVFDLLKTKRNMKTKPKKKTTAGQNHKNGVGKKKKKKKKKKKEYDPPVAMVTNNKVQADDIDVKLLCDDERMTHKS